MIGKTSSELIEQFGPAAFEAVHESDQDGLVYFAADGTIEYCNRAAMRLFGVNESIRGANIFEIAENGFPQIDGEPIFPSDHVKRARRSFNEGVPTRSEMVLIRGEERQELEVVWGPVHQNGEIAGVVGSYRDISPRPDIHDQLAQEATKLEEQRQFLASVIEVLDDGLFVYNPEMELELINPAAGTLLEVERAVEGLRVSDCLTGSALRDADRLEEQLRETLTGAQGRSAIHFVEHADGQTRRLEVRTEPLGLAEDRYICKLTDTTQRIEIQQMDLLGRIARLGTEGETREQLADEIVEAIVRRLDVDFAVLTHLDGNLLCPTAWRGILLQDGVCVELDANLPKLREVLASDAPRRLNEWLWADEPSRGQIEQVVIPLSAAGEQLGTLHLGYLGGERSGYHFTASLDDLDVAFTDALGSYVTAALQNVRLLDQRTTEQHRLAAVIDTLPDGVILYNGRGEVLLTNAAAEEITDYEEWWNINGDTPPYRVTTPGGHALPRSDWPFFRAVRKGEPCREMVVFDFDTHRRDIVFSAAPIGDGEEPATYVATLRDVTEKRQVDRRKDEFLSIASHELRSPLTPLTGLLQLARRQRERGEQVDLTLLTRAERQINRLTRLIDGLLDLTRIETGRIQLEKRPMQLGAFVRQAVQPWKLNPKDIELEYSGPAEAVKVNADPDRLNQVLTNVVDNAIKYSDTGGVIRVDVTADGEMAVLGIEDEGEGMDEETIEHIFDRFFHGSSSGSRTRSMGLGLYICRQIIEQHAGRIAVDSEKGRGTRVEVRLPVED